MAVSKIAFLGTAGLSAGGIAVGSFLIPNSNEEKVSTSQPKLTSSPSVEEVKADSVEVKVCQIYEAISPNQNGSPKVSSLRHRGDKDKFLATVTRSGDSGFKGEVETRCKALIGGTGKLDIYVWESTGNNSEKKWIYSSWLQNDDWVTKANLVQETSTQNPES
ncbi:hypothetical protein HF1_10640 [Mycoplasma haemofelis str. Langford 1]|uniref:Uncharacterized protein n=1 Tax=Mycoplasma haemofelis (strain Langford 1) TaxID=941640 RepID=E8ZIV1_MYCHL|nr:hypothetical protein [Mycoplasma haemofelis]CBY93072.1 hypothetical protein HF1_10640 [Mycoplasma haemofelis str. Langford 1]